MLLCHAGRLILKRLTRRPRGAVSRANERVAVTRVIVHFRTTRAFSTHDTGVTVLSTDIVPCDNVSISMVRHMIRENGHMSPTEIIVWGYVQVRESMVSMYVIKCTY